MNFEKIPKKFFRLGVSREIFVGSLPKDQNYYNTDCFIGQ